MFRLYKSDDSIVEFTTEEGARKTLEAFPDKYFLSPSTKEEIKTIKNGKKKKQEDGE